MGPVDIFLLALTAGVAIWFFRTVTDPNRDIERSHEDDARAFFDEHGHWPDETPEEAAERAERAAAAERLAREWRRR